MAKTVTPDELVTEIEKDFEALFRGIATEFSERMIQKAPANTGALKASIKAAVNSETIAFSPSTVDPEGGSTQAGNASVIKGMKGGDVINIVVGAPYGQEIEEGDSEKAPQGFILTTGEEINAIVDAVKGDLGKYRS